MAGHVDTSESILHGLLRPGCSSTPQVQRVPDIRFYTLTAHPAHRLPRPHTHPRPQAQKPVEWQVGKYVRVYGNLKTFEGKRSLTAFAVKPVTDHNEVRRTDSAR